MHIYLLSFISITLLILSILYIIGDIIRKNVLLNFKYNYQYTFFNLFTGTIIIITCFALFFTNGRTILLGNIILGILGFYYWKSKRSASIEIIESISLSKRLPTLIIEGFVFFFIYYLYKYLTADNITGVPFWFDQDNISYSKNIWYIINSGNESSVFDYFDLSKRTPSPFHYYDLWFAGGIATVFNLNYLHTLQLITHPIGFFTIIIGLLAILEFKIEKISLFHKFLCIGILFFGGLYFECYNHIEIFKRYGFMYRLNVFKFPKSIISYTFILASLNLYFNRRIYLALLVFLGLILSQIATAPTLLSTLFLFFLGLLIFTKNLKYVKYLISILVVVIFIGIFYILLKTGNSDNLYSQNFTREYLFSLLTIKQFITLIKLSIGDGLLGLAFIHIFSIILIILLLALNYNKIKFSIFNHLYLVIFFIMLILIGIVLSFLFGFVMFDAFQFFSSIGTPFLTIIIFLLLIYLFDKLSTIYKVLILIYVIFVAVIAPKTFENPYNYSQEYLLKTNQTFKLLNPKGVFLMTKEDYSKSANHCNPLFGVLNYHLCIWNRNANTIPMSVFDIPRDSKNNFTNAVKLSSFYIFVEKQKAKHHFISLEQSQIDFIDTYDIDYLITTKDVVLNTLLKSRVKTIIVDSNTKERFILLNHK